MNSLDIKAWYKALEQKYYSSRKKRAIRVIIVDEFRWEMRVNEKKKEKCGRQPSVTPAQQNWTAVGVFWACKWGSKGSISSLDISTAFLNSRLPSTRKIYMRQPKALTDAKLLELRSYLVVAKGLLTDSIEDALYLALQKITLMKNAIFQRQHVLQLTELSDSLLDAPTSTPQIMMNTPDFGKIGTPIKSI
eukprot:1151864-Amphidinium_carterae.3